MDRKAGTSPRFQSFALLLLVIAMLAGLPIAVWLDLRNLTDAKLHLQAADLNSAITSMRDYYARNVVDKVLAAPGSIEVTNHHRSIPGAIPIPATLSLELGQVIAEQQRNISYRFISDYPFKGRPAHQFDDFERHALAELRANPNQVFADAKTTIFSDRVRLIVPVMMESSCVSCHNTHPESPKRDWKVGDVRGIQEVTINQQIAGNIFSFKYLLIYFALVASAGLTFLLLQRRQAIIIHGINQQLQEASRHKSQFLANMSHELRTPLNAVLGYTELILDSVYGEMPEKARSVVDRIQRSGRHLLSLINEVLDLSKIEAGQVVLTLGDYSLKSVVETVYTAVEPLAEEKSLALKAEVQPDLPIGRGDERRLTQVLLNLVGNAIKFTDQGEVRIDASKANGSFEVAVRDTGPGISAADRSKIFEEFQQADNAITRTKGGTGLGLAISKRIIEMHGGRIWVESNVGHGSTFAFTVPIKVDRQYLPGGESSTDPS